MAWKDEGRLVSGKIYRLIHKDQYTTRDGERVPKESQFEIRFDKQETGLSVDWSKHATPEKVLITCGLTYRFNSKDYKKPDLFSVFPLDVETVSNTKDISGIFHDLIYNRPEILGTPNNRAHSLVKYPKAGVQKLRVALCDMARNAGPESVDMDYVILEVVELRNIKEANGVRKQILILKRFVRKNSLESFVKSTAAKLKLPSL